MTLNQKLACLNKAGRLLRRAIGGRIAPPLAECNLSDPKDLSQSARSGWFRPSVAFAVIAVGYAIYTEVRPEPATPSPEIARAHSAIVSEFSGIATVSDGDTLRIGERRIELDGILTPQRSVRCGDVNVYRAAADALREITRSETVTCRISDLPGANGRDVAQCTIEGVSLNQHMVASGWARDRGGGYAEAEARARAEQRGLWGLACPADLWRGSAPE